MSADSRKRTLARIRGATRGQDAESIATELGKLGVAPIARAPHRNLLVSFMVNVLRNHGSLAIAADRLEAVKAVRQYLYDKFRSQRLVAGNEPHLAAMPWREGGVLPRFGELTPGEKAALSYADWGIAETGAITLATGKHNPPANHLLAEHHLVLLDVDRLLPDLESFWRQTILTRGKRPRGINFIAGPSSTSDIEARLVYGAHGPQALHIILLGKVSAEAMETARQLAQPPGESG